MTIIRYILSACTLMLVTLPCEAGPCSQQIVRMQAKVDAAIEARAHAGPMGPQSQAANLNRQPTPSSIAAAEARLGEGDQMEQAVAALARARTADAAGDKSGCEQALAEADRAISP